MTADNSEEEPLEGAIHSRLNNLRTPEIVQIAQIMGMENNQIPAQCIESIVAGNILVGWAQRKGVLKKLKKYIDKYQPGQINQFSDNPLDKAFEEHVAELFLLLDKKDQRKKLEHALGNDRVGVFLVQEDKKVIQDWLVYDLAKNVPGFSHGERYEMCIPRYPIFNSLNDFWKMQFNKSLHNHETVAERLINVLQGGHSVIIVINDNELERLQSHREGHADPVNNIADKIFDEICVFWSYLVEQFRPIEKNIFRSHLVLFLVQQSKSSSTAFDKLLKYIKESKTATLTSLPSVNKIPSKDVCWWLKEDDFYNFASKLVKHNCIQSIENAIKKDSEVDTFELFDSLLKQIFNGTNILEIQGKWNSRLYNK